MRHCPNTGRATCPAPEGATCAAIATGHRRFCQLADPAHPDHDPAYVAHLAGVEYRPPAPAPGPGLLTKAGNFVGAVAAHALAGFAPATNEEASRRLALCRACPEHFDAASEACNLCGCSMPLKVTWAEQRCPIGKW